MKNPFTLLRVSRLLGIQVPEEEILGLSPAEAQAIKIAMITGQSLEGRLGALLEKMKVLVEEAQEALRKVDGTITGETFQISRKGREVFIEYPDIITYLQGSGRSSRLLNGGLTQGLSVILVDDQVIFELFKRKMNFLIPGFAPVNFEALELDRVKEEIERTRREGGNKVEIKTGLLVVESPTKAKTISRLFGFPARRSVGGVPVYETVIVEGNRVYILDVMATKGHVTDLTLEEKGYYGVEIKETRSALYTPTSTGVPVVKDRSAKK